MLQNGFRIVKSKFNKHKNRKANIMEQDTKRLGGMKGFIVVWLGQIISVLASGMTQFALTLWIYEQTRSAMAFAGMQVAFILPFLLMSPIAGVWVDRYNRKLMMMVSDLAAAVGTVIILVFHSMDILEFWHLYVVSALIGIGNTFQWPAYSAAISTMVPKEQYGRANGLMSVMEAGPAVLAPLLAGALLPIIGFNWILSIDLISFTFAIGALLIVHIPDPEKTVEGQERSGNVLQEAWYGFQYIFERRSLLGLQLIFLFGNLFSGMAFAIMAPMILARTNSNEILFGSLQSIMAIGGLAGGIIMSAWGGFKRKVHGVLLGWIMSSIFGMVLLGVGRGLAVWAVAAVFITVPSALINASNQAIWQVKVAPDLQGRVFSARRLIAWFTQPIAPLIAGALADYVLEPRMIEGGSLTGSFGWLVGSGPGAGMGLLFVFAGLAASLVGLSGYFIPAIRNAEDLLPDHDQLEKVEAVEAEELAVEAA
jgi:MFS family permease